MVSVDPDMRFTFGAVLGGAYLATALSGALCVQAILYFRNYPRDPVHLKAMVALVWVMDSAQSCCIVMLTYQYVIFKFSRPEAADHIYWTAVAAIISTALSTFTANGYFTHRVHRLSEGNWCLTAPIVGCLAIRLALAIRESETPFVENNSTEVPCWGKVTGVEMLHLRSFKAYREQYGVIKTGPVHKSYSRLSFGQALLTTGLSLSAFTDIVITASLCHYLRTLNRGLDQTKKMLSTIVSFAENNGVLTCVVALASLICWLVMPANLVFLGLHFTIGKCYSNSLLATLNMRDYVWRTAGLPPEVFNVTASVYSSTSFRERARGTLSSNLEMYGDEQPGAGATGQLAIKVDRTVHYH